jgi:hypothetical protein
MDVSWTKVTGFEYSASVNSTKKNVDRQRGFSERQYTASMPDG